MSPLRPWRAAGVASAAWLTLVPGALPAPAAAAEPVFEVAARSDETATHIAAAAQRFGLPSAWIEAVMRAESAGDPHATSPAGAMGLMQIMPATWADLRARHGLGHDPYHPRDSILAGAAYMRELFDRYGAPGFLAAYNAGPGRYENSLATGRLLPAETRAYLAKLAPIVGLSRADEAIPRRPESAPWRHSALFASHPAVGSDVGQRNDDPQPTQPSTRDGIAVSVPASGRGGLFVPLSSPPSGR